MKNSVITVLSSITIAEVEEGGENLLQSSFALTERNYLVKRHIRSTAGWLALKKSLIQLFENTQNHVLSERDIVLRCLSDGRPIIVKMDGAVNLPSNNLFVSISHSRTTAYGLTVLQEE